MPAGWASETGGPPRGPRAEGRTPPAPRCGRLWREGRAGRAAASSAPRARLAREQRGGGVRCAVWRQQEGRSERREKRKVKRPEAQFSFLLVFSATEVNRSARARNSLDQGCAVPGARMACSLRRRLRAGLGAASAELLGRVLCGCRCPGLAAPSAPPRAACERAARGETRCCGMGNDLESRA